MRMSRLRCFAVIDADDRAQFGLEIIDLVAHAARGIDDQHQVELGDLRRRLIGGQPDQLPARRIGDEHRARVGNRPPRLARRHGDPFAQPVEPREEHRAAVGLRRHGDAVAVAARHDDVGKGDRLAAAVVDLHRHHPRRVDARQAAHLLPQIAAAVDIGGVEFGVEQIVMLARGQNARLRLRLWSRIGAWWHHARIRARSRNGRRGGGQFCSTYPIRSTVTGLADSRSGLDDCASR